MTIHRFFDNDNVNIYFHMKNHYKKLKKVKSVVDTSPPQGFTKANSTPPNSERSWKTCSYEEKHSKECAHLPNHSATVKKHNCAAQEGKKDASARSSSLPPRPKTRRHPYELPQKSQWKSRSQSVGQMSRKKVPTELRQNNVRNRRKTWKNINTIPEIESEKAPVEVLSGNDEVPSDTTNRSNSSRKSTSCQSEKTVTKSRNEEHEYLQFLLRITEDIIVNNLYTSEDLKRVFRNHVEANRDRLKMEKMEAQLNRLCKELRIPYNSIENCVENGECYSNFFTKPIPTGHMQKFENCECASQRNLEVNTREHKASSVDDSDEPSRLGLCLEDNVSRTVLLNNRSLSRVTECTEPSNSAHTLSDSVKCDSVTTVPSFGHVTTLPCFEASDVISRGETDNLRGREEGTGDLGALESEPPLTEKEKMECLEEDIAFNKCRNSVLERDMENNGRTQNSKHLINDFDTIFLSNDNNVEDKTRENTVNKKLPQLSSVVITDNYIHELNNENVLFHLSNVEHNLDETVAVKLDTSLPDGNKIPTMIYEKGTNSLDNSLKITFEKGIQVEISKSDKECNTDMNSNEHVINDDYVLVNGPIYVPRRALNGSRKMHLRDSQFNTQQVRREVSETLRHEPQTPLSTLYATELDREASYLRKNTFSRLLHSDYDLTPQRDDNVAEKYHHLLLDATTSVMNLCAEGPQVKNSNSDALLLTGNYCVQNENSKEDTEQEVANEESERSGAQPKDSIFSTNELSSDGQYEIKSYTMANELNGSVALSHDAQMCSQMAELDISLTAYEIKSENCDPVRKTNRNDVAKERNLVGETSDSVDNGNSQLSSVRSEKSQNSSTKNVLGKRKLYQPS